MITTHDGKCIFEKLIYDLQYNNLEIAKENIIRKLKPEINDMLLGIITFEKNEHNLIKFVSGFYFIPPMYKKYRNYPCLALSELSDINNNINTINLNTIELNTI